MKEFNCLKVWKCIFRKEPKRGIFYKEEKKFFLKTNTISKNFIFEICLHYTQKDLCHKAC